MITREADYAIRSVLRLARAEAGARMTAVALAEDMQIPYRFLRGITRQLVKANILLSKRGNGGGLALARPPRQISLLDVMRAIQPRACTLNACLGDVQACSLQEQCPVHDHLGEVQIVLEEQLAAIRFDRLAREGAASTPPTPQPLPPSSTGSDPATDSATDSASDPGTDPTSASPDAPPPADTDTFLSR